MKAERRDQVSPGSIACDSVAAALCVSHIELIAFQSIKWLFTFDVMSGIYQWVDETIGQQFAGPRDLGFVCYRYDRFLFSPATYLTRWQTVAYCCCHAVSMH